MSNEFRSLLGSPENRAAREASHLANYLASRPPSDYDLHLSELQHKEMYLQDALERVRSKIRRLQEHGPAFWHRGLIESGASFGSTSGSFRAGGPANSLGASFHSSAPGNRFTENSWGASFRGLTSGVPLGRPAHALGRPSNDVFNPVAQIPSPARAPR